jgi:hypothetical protein
MTERPESAFLTPPVTPYTGSSVGTPLAGTLRRRVRSDDEESLASVTSFSSTTFRGRKRGFKSNTPKMPEYLVMEMRTTSVADIGAVLMHRAEEIMKVANTSSNLKRHLCEDFEGGGKLDRRGIVGIGEKKWNWRQR